jgi:hypothetical protein
MLSRLALSLTQPPNQCVPGVKRPGREADHLPPTSAVVNKTWICSCFDYQNVTCVHLALITPAWDTDRALSLPTLPHTDKNEIPL